MTIRPEAPADFKTIEALNIAAFKGDAEAILVNMLRINKRYTQGMSLVHEQDGLINGHILFSDLPLKSPQKQCKAAALAPLAVLPDYQKKGIGSALIKKGLENLKKLNYEAVVVLGSPGYYGRFGFRPELAKDIECAYSGPHLMGLELAEGALKNLGKAKAFYAREFENLE